MLELVRQNADWVQLHMDLPHAEVARLIATHRYGIHGMLEEPFGMAAAEMLRGGCIVFLPDGGGQIEIAGREHRLLFRTADEAVAKITAVMMSPNAQGELRAYLAARAALFSPERFIEIIRAIVAGDRVGAAVER